MSWVKKALCVGLLWLAGGVGAQEREVFAPLLLGREESEETLALTETALVEKSSVCELGFSPELSPVVGGGFEHPSGFAYVPATLRVFDDGSGPMLYAGGSFEVASGRAAYGVARFTGQRWEPVGAGFSGPVASLVEYEGRLYAAGSFEFVGSGFGGSDTKVNAVARWTGEAWVGVGGGFSGFVSDLMIWNDGSGPTLLAIGDFEFADHGINWQGDYLGSPADGIAIYRGEEHWDGIFPDPPRYLSPYRAVVVTEGGQQVVYLQSSRFSLDRWDGSAVVEVYDDPGFTAEVGDLQAYDDGSGPALYAVIGNDLRRYRNGVWTVLGTGDQRPGQLSAVVGGPLPGLYVGGAFTDFAGAGPWLVRWTGAGWSPAGLGLAERAGPVLPFADGTGVRLYAGVAGGVRRWGAQGWERIEPESINGAVRALAYVGSDLYVGGDFTQMGEGMPALHVARVGPGGAEALGEGLNAPVTSLAVLGGEIYAAGPFTASGGTSLNFVARFTGSSWVAVAEGLPTPPRVLAALDDGTGLALYAGGAGYLARLDGTSWQVSSFPGTIWALAVYEAGGIPALYAGGSAGGDFWGPDGRVARYEAGAWTPLGADFTDPVYALHVYDGELYAGGSFVETPTLAARRLASWNGTRWAPAGLIGKSTFSDLEVVRTLSSFTPADGLPRLVAAGTFKGVNEPAKQHSHLTVRGPQGGWKAVGFGMNSTVYALQPAGARLYLGGAFQEANGLASSRLAELSGPVACPEQTLTVTSPVSGFWTRSASVRLMGGASLPGGILYLNGRRAEMDAWGGFDLSSLPLVEGWNRFELALKGRYPATATVEVLRDSTAPALSWAAPAAGVSLLAGRPWFEGVATEAGTGLDAASLRLERDGVPLAAECQVMGSRLRCRPTTDLPVGPVSLRFAAADLAGNSAVSVSRSFTIGGVGVASTMTVTGLVQLPGGGAAAGAKVYVEGDANRAQVVTGADGRFTLAGVPVPSAAPLTLAARFKPAVGPYYEGRKGDIAPIAGGTVDVGTVTLGFGCELTTQAGGWPGPGVSGGAARVLALAVYDDGRGPALYAGGDFQTAGGVLASNLARWNGASWEAVGTGTDGPVRALAVYDPGTGPELYLGGTFTVAGGVAAGNVASWNGSRFAPLGTGVDTSVYALAVHNDGSGEGLFVGGAFRTAGGQAANSIARWRGGQWTVTGSLADFSNLLYNTGIVYALVSWDDGDGPALYAGGKFNRADANQKAWGVARYRGGVWSNLSLGLGIDDDSPARVHALTIHDDGSGPSLYAAGSFNWAGVGLRVESVARWAGGRWHGVGQGLEAPGLTTFQGDTAPYKVQALASFDDGTGWKLYAAGDLTLSGERPLSNLAVFQDGAWQSVGSGLSAPGSGGMALLPWNEGSGSKLFVGGGFTVAGTETASGIARWDGSTYAPVGVGDGEPLETAVVLDDGTGAALYVGGRSVSRLDRAGWASLGPGLEGTVHALALLDRGAGPMLYAGGNFTNRAGSTYGLARHNGSGWEPVLGGPDGPVRALRSFDDGSGAALYLAGTFTTRGGGVAASGILRFDGTAWAGLGSGLSPALAYALTVWDDGSGPALYVGGEFTTAGGVAARGVARWRGGAWSALGAGLGDTVYALEPWDDGSGSALWATGGRSTCCGFVQKYKVATGWTALSTPTLVRGRALTVFDDGAGPTLHVTGDVGSLGVGRVSGSTLVSLAPLVLPLGRALAAFDDGAGPALFVGGGFSTVGGQSAPYLGRFRRATSCAADTTAPTVAFTSPAEGTITTSNRPTVAFSYADAGLGVDTATVTLTIEGVAGTVACTKTATAATCTPTANVAAGRRVWTATVRDWAGNTGTATRTITIDLANPTLTWVSPAANAWQASARPELVFTATDATSGVDAASFVLHRSSVTDVIPTSCALAGTELRCQPLADLGVGPAVVVNAKVKDFAGRLSTTTGRTLSIDASPPLIGFSQPAAGALVAAARPQLVLAATDGASESGIDETTLALTLGGAPLAATCTGTTTLACTPNADLPQGSVELGATIRDRVGRLSAPAARSFTVDSIAPTLAFTAPAAGSTTANGTPTFVLAASDAGGLNPSSLAFTANGTAFAASCTWTGSTASCVPSAPLVSGATTVGATLRDAAGNSVTATLELVVAGGAAPPGLDVEAPWLAFSEPGHGGFFSTYAGTFELLAGDAGSGIDATSVVLRAGGQTIPVTCAACWPRLRCALGAPLPVGDTVAVEATVEDSQGNVSNLAQATWVTRAGLDLVAPRVWIDEPVAGLLVREGSVVVVGRVSELSTVLVAGQAVVLSAELAFTHTVVLAQGANPLTVTATDAAGNVGTAHVVVTFDDQAPGPVDVTKVTVTEPVDGFSTVTGAAGAIVVSEPGLRVELVDAEAGGSTTVAVASDGSFAGTLAAFPQDTLRLTVVDPAGNASPGRSTTVPGVVPVPPDPATVAPPLDPTVATGFCAGYDFLWTGANRVQYGLAADTLDCKTVGVLRGRVLDAAGQPLSGARVRARDNARLGFTLTRADGAYDFAVPGGGPLTLAFEKDGRLPAVRMARPRLRDVARVEDVVLLAPDSAVTVVSFGNASPAQTARGSVSTDSDGERRATVLFGPGTKAELVLPGGGRQELAAGTVRATEYTVGPRGPQRMPAPLPPSTDYTYAVELALDEAVAAGAESVAFTPSVAVYVENFLELPVGTTVPAGYYSRREGRWVPAPDGRVVRILGINTDLAVLDLTGTGTAASPADLASVGIAQPELQQLAALYSVGQELWRVPVAHFTPWDFNFPADVEPGARGPRLPAPNGGDQDKKDEDCLFSGSLIECHNQILGETVGIEGSSLTLNYRSDRTAGRKIANELTIPLSEVSLPPGVQSVELEIEIAGQRVQQSFPASGGQSFTFAWDGKDGFGRSVQGRRPFQSTVSYTYERNYEEPEPCEGPCFGDGGGPPVAPAREPVKLSQTQRGFLGTWDQKKQLRLGGWSLSGHHFYDPIERVLYLGDGSRRSAQGRHQRVRYLDERTTDPSGSSPPRFELPGDFSLGPDGSAYVVESERCTIQRLHPDGQIEPWVGQGCILNPPPGTPALHRETAAFSDIANIEVGPDGLVYFIADGAVWRIEESGSLTNVISAPRLGLDAPRIAIPKFRQPVDIAFSPDGWLWVYSGVWARSSPQTYFPYTITLARVDLQTGSWELRAAGDVAHNAPAAPLESRTDQPYHFKVHGSDPGWAILALGHGEMTVAEDGTVFFSTAGFADALWKMPPDGKVERIAGRYSFGQIDDPDTDLPLLGDGEGAYLRTAPWWLDPSGYRGDGGPASEGWLWFPMGLEVREDGGLLFADHHNGAVREVDRFGILRTLEGGASPVAIRERWDGERHRLMVLDSQKGELYEDGDPMPEPPLETEGRIEVPSEDGSVIFVFDATGRHLSTKDAGSAEELAAFGYDEQGLLISITDAFGQVTTLERNGSGEVTRIVAPKGQETTLAYSGTGYLASVTNPAGETTRFTYTQDGLLLERKEPLGNATTFTWDSDGRLVSDIDALGGSQTFARLESASGPQGRPATEVTRTTAMGRLTTQRTDYLLGGLERLTRTFPDGTVTVTDRTPDGLHQTTYPDGTVASMKEGADPRFGQLAPIATSSTVTLPSGLAVTTTSARTMVPRPGGPVPGSSAGDLRNFLTQDTVTVGDRVASSEYDYLERRLTTTSPEGRVSRSFRDAFGRLTRAESPGVEPVLYSFEAEGRVSEVTRGDRTLTYTYNAQGYPWKVTDPLGREVSSTYDSAGRVTVTTLADGRQVQFAYDLNGNLTSITPPSRPQHGFGYNTTDRPNQSTAPEVGGTVPVTTLAYNLDHQVTQVTRPDGTTISYEYAPTSGRLLSTTTPRGVTTPTYDAAGRVTNVAGPGGEELAFTYDGSLPKTVTWSGTVSGSLAYSYNSFLETSQVVVTAGAASKTLLFSRNKDAQLTQAGAMSFSYDPVTGFGTGSALGALTDEPSFNSFGELASYTARAGSATLFDATYTRDKLGRVTTKTETVGSETSTWAYEYDLAGRLVEVEKDGLLVESYAYDANSNRTAWTDPWGSGTAVYDDQDRLTDYAGTTFTYNANGERLTKATGSGTIGTVYDVTGQLLQVTLPSGITIDYVLDAANRRVAKKVNGSLAKGYLWAGGSLVAELDAAGNLESTYVYGRKPHVPEYLLRDSETYRLVTDPLGSVRLVVRVSDGQVVQRLDYSAFGRVLFDSNPGFQPFGYAGGLWEPQTGLVRFGARDYDPEVGRWAAKDPIGFSGGDTNLYGYVVGDPVNLVDPSGRSALDTLQFALDLVGLVPGLGELADLANGLVSLARGDCIGAALSFAAMVPFAGAAAVAVKFGRAADAAAGARNGFATIRRHGAIHFSVEVSDGVKSVGTHQAMGELGNRSTYIRNAADRPPEGPVTASATIELPDAQSAMDLQESLISAGDIGPYDLVENSCVSHVCDVLGAGGDAVPARNGTDQLRYLKQLLGGGRP